MGAATLNAETVSRYVVSARERNIPDDVLEAARKCLVDWCGVALGARAEEAQLATRRAVLAWGSQGGARVLLGGTAAPGPAALINGTMAHCLDFDDTHVGSIAHLSGPIWATVLALGTHQGADEQLMLRAFITGFETGARLGGEGMGDALNRRGWHSTSVFGCLGAVAAACVMLGLDEAATRNALGAAATQTGGVTGSFGTMSKPFHAGKAAFNAILAAQLAAEGFVAKTDLLEPESDLAATLVQDASRAFSRIDFADGWEILRNTFKPYASCLLTHPVIDAARKLADQVDPGMVERIDVHVNSVCTQLAGKPAPTTPLEGKFSTAFCAALGLTGHSVNEGDFNAELLGEAGIRSLVARTRLHASETMDPRSAELSLILADGGVLHQVTPLALGNPDNPMSWGDIRAKFDALVTPVLGDQAGSLFDCLRAFGGEGSLKRLDALLAEQ
jgi:2-methylcitrate dehydratase PrpD